MKKTQVVQIKFHNFGKLSDSHRCGPRVYKVSGDEVETYKANGWEYVSRGASYCYMRAPVGFSGRDAILTVTVPTKEYCVYLATDLHELGEEISFDFDGWTAEYKPAESGVSTTTAFSMLDDTRRIIQTPFTNPARFSISGPIFLFFTAVWDDGDKAPPRICYDADRFVSDPQ